MSTVFQQPIRPRRTAAPLAGAVHHVQDADVLDGPARVLGRLADVALAAPRLRSVLRGERLGHALHPLLTDFPLGAWMSSSLLDLFGGRRARPAAAGLLGFGLAAVVPTALSGLAEWQASTGPARRVGLVHARPLRSRPIAPGMAHEHLHPPPPPARATARQAAQGGRHVALVNAEVCDDVCGDGHAGRR
jgi:hypothetical protein